MRIPEPDRWTHLVAGAFRLDQTPASRGEAIRFLTSVLEVFPAGLDPVEDFEGYAVRRMAGAILRALEAEAGR